jgi:L-methionine (R)-S-oxide reductase
VYRLLADGSHVLGPFAGPAACTRIPLGKGVIGAASLQENTIVVKNVHEFEGHIACDPRSQSEIVINLRDKSGRKVGVLDVDAMVQGAFEDADTQAFFARLAEMIGKSSDWPN